MSSPQKQTSAQTFRANLRLQTLEIGHRLVREEGLQSVQARRIAKEARCAVGSIYNVFEDLDGLIIALNMQTLSDLGRSLATAFEKTRDEPTYDRLLALAEAYFEFAQENQNAWRAIFEHHLPAEKSAPADYRQDQDNLFALVEDCLRTVIEDDETRRSGARALFASVHGIVSLSLDRKLGDFDPESTSRQILFLVNNAAKGLQSN
ncbi:MAG: TetR/AcrR family transcriptional regulator [Filomicrobium sp.]